MNNEFSFFGTLELWKSCFGPHFPLANLKANSKTLCLSAPLFGELVFKPADVISVNTFVQIPISERGINIERLKDDYPWTVRFSSMFMTQKGIIRRILKAVFIPTGRKTANCLECGNVISERSEQCKKCGWTCKVEERNTQLPHADAGLACHTACRASCTPSAGAEQP